MNHYQALRLVAMRAVVRPDREYLIRRIIRWYAKTFSTPIGVVEEMPLDRVLLDFYEEKYAEMSEEDRDAEIAELVATEDERYTQMVAKDAEEADLFEFERLMEAEDREKSKRNEERRKKKAEGKIADPQQQRGPVVERELPQLDLPQLPAELPPSITMSFMAPDEFERELEGFGAMGQPEKS